MDNYQIALQRMSYLLRKFEKDAISKDFLENVIEKGQAEMVPQTEPKRDNCKVWLIPQDWVYHPKKATIRVVFNCSTIFRCLASFPKGGSWPNG